MHQTKISCTLSLVLCLTSSLTWASERDIKASGYSIAEMASKTVVVDGVSTKYMLGAIGVKADKQLTDRLALQGTWGKGYLPSHEINFAGYTFTGSVYSDVKSLGVNYELATFGNQYTLDSEFVHTWSEIKAPTLIGTKNNSQVTGHSSASMDFSSLMFTLNRTINDRLSLNGRYGWINWDFEALGTAYANSNVTAKKYIKSSNINSQIGVGIHYTPDYGDLLFNLYTRKMSASNMNSNRVYGASLEFHVDF